MDIVKIKREKSKNTFEKLNIEYFFEKNNELLIKLNGKQCYSVYEGQTIIFNRIIKDEDGNFKKILGYSKVLKEDDNHIIHAEIPYVSKKFLNNYHYVISSDELMYCVELDEDSDLFPQDNEASFDNILYAYSSNGEIVGEYNRFTIPLKYNDTPVTYEDCITNCENVETCGKEYRYIKMCHYNFLPNSFDRKKIVIFGAERNVLEKTKYFELKYNPFYYYTIELNDKGVPSELDDFGVPIKHCVFYGDIWWNNYFSTSSPEIIYVNDGLSDAFASIETDYLNVGLLLTNNSDGKIINEESVVDSFVEETKNNIIPDVIDMERVKYSPIVNDGKGTVCDAEKIEFILHFRKRKVSENEGELNTILTKHNFYEDGWYIDKDIEPTVWWNGMDYSQSAFSRTAFDSFYTNSGHTSDLIGYMNFTDNDIFYRKLKVGKSFLRLSFYTSKDPIEQKLLYYSTVFIDETELYGKFLRQKINIEENEIEDNPIISGNSAVRVVFCDDNSVSARLDVKMCVYNEMNMDKSSDGFNIYLFSDDAKSINSARTIYMKIEFNHAGNGKTIPMIAWPNNNGVFVPLKIDNFFDALYIPVEISYFNGRYTYALPNVENDFGENTLRLILFEPKLDN